MKVLVTGGMGFIGSNLIRHLLSSDTKLRVTNLDNLSIGANPANLKDLDVPGRYRYIKGDITDSRLVSKLVKIHEAIISCAAETHVDRSISNPRPFLNSNVLGTFTILEAIRKQNSEVKMVHVSTDETYGDIPQGSFSEEDRLKPSNPYCLHPKSSVLLANGQERAVEDLVIGDSILSYDFVLKETKPSTVCSKFPFGGVGLDFYELEVGNTLIRCTGDHRFFIKRPKKWKKNKLDCRQDFDALPILEEKCKNLGDGDWIATIRKISNVESTSKIQPSWARFLGYFTGDGYVKKSRNRKNGGIQYTICLADRKKEFVEFYNAFLPNSGCIYRHKTKNCWYSQTGCIEVIRELLKESCSRTSNEREIPDNIMVGNKEVLINFIGGFFDAEGWRGNGKIEICSFSTRLLKQLSFLLRKLGIANTILNNKVIISDSLSYNIFRESIPTLKKVPKIEAGSQKTNDDTIIWSPMREPRKIEFPSLVYDIEVDETHNYVVSPNILSHNSATKAAADMLTLAYHRTYGLHATITRCTNNFGPYQHLEKLMPKTIVRALRDLPIPIYGSGMQVRDWIYVQDHCEALRTVLEAGRPGEIYNISSGNEIPNLKIVESILQVMGKPKTLIQFVEDRPGHDLRYSLNSEKLRSQTGWSPQHSFQDALEKTVKWYLENEWWWRKQASEKILHPTPWKRKW